MGPILHRYKNVPAPSLLIEPHSDNTTASFEFFLLSLTLANVWCDGRSEMDLPLVGVTISQEKEWWIRILCLLSARVPWLRFVLKDGSDED